MASLMYGAGLRLLECGLGVGLAMGISRHTAPSGPAKQPLAPPPSPRVGRTAGLQRRRPSRRRGEAGDLPLASSLCRVPDYAGWDRRSAESGRIPRCVTRHYQRLFRKANRRSPGR
jgi:hypothetical protein